MNRRMTFTRQRFPAAYTLLVAVLLLSSAGCRKCASWFYQPPEPPPMLGTRVDDVMRPQEENAEASKYVIYQHEFKLNRAGDADPMAGLRLNEYGEDHVKRIAQNLRQGVSYPVIVERSQTSVRPGTRYEYPVHFNPQLDNRRREVVVQALTALGIPDAEQRVVVAPALTDGITSTEAESAYRRGQSGGRGFGFGGFGFGGGGTGAFGAGF